MEDRNFPYALAAVCGAAGLVGVTLGGVLLWAAEKLRSLRVPQLPIEWEGVE